MQEADHKHWLDQLEVTGPIKGIMDFVDELSRNYDRRIAALHVDYQKDVAEILACYKQEKQEFSTQLDEQKELIATLESELKSVRESYNTLNIEHKLTKDSLDTARNELSELTKVLKQEEELLQLTRDKIKSANEQLRKELETRGVEPSPQVETTPNAEPEPVVRPKIRFKRTRDFFQQVIADRISRPIMLRPKKKEPIIMPDDEVTDHDEYSF